ncbi:MAG: RNA 2',3'-cyclic phosphodiesterase [Nitrospinaceae bacterium]|nr:RNA 2',3'-cyclic phosphodiesterase [Nitrospinaceae bacterium]NIR54599.1 RNA 2',3'-cyclic phosphodiesterase [Nitrospinaceae bacterium]NIS85021.1 RNA 2',3'-cyclic phosphodiesterase [Nitrospinaceae bacterium]NIT81832.1 RNA 2',3'-cyclic phosphodiesterase [Nitrospinaceae bacterium]NIU44095.1 RNA 2',3'-cyclic phosphodiesterase [Nitrospinaceae bacterium]
MDPIRTFIAIDVPPKVLEAITDVQNRFKSLGLHASWVRPGNIHLTLKFLGDIDPSQVPGIKDSLAPALSRLAPCQLALDGVGVFPDFKRPRVLWLGLRDEQGNLKALHTALEEVLEKLGFPAEHRRFSPHLTLARIKSPKGKKELRRELERLNDQGIDPNPFQADSVKWYKSQLTPKGSIYTVLEHFNLNQ